VPSEALPSTIANPELDEKFCGKPQIQTTAPRDKTL
jgi:hypothetical protein